VKRKLKELIDNLALKAGYITVTKAEKLVADQRERCAVRASQRFHHAKSNKDMYGAVINTWLVTEKQS
jgi:hypothetical protein